MKLKDIKGFPKSNLNERQLRGCERCLGRYALSEKEIELDVEKVKKDFLLWMGYEVCSYAEEDCEKSCSICEDKAEMIAQALSKAKDLLKLKGE